MTETTPADLLDRLFEAHAVFQPLPGPDARILRFNPAFAALLNSPSATLTGRTLRETVPALEDFWFLTLADVSRSGETRRFEQSSPALGRRLRVLAWGEPDGNVGLLALDLTAASRAGEDLGVLRRAVDSLPDSVVITDAAGDIEYVNPGFERMTGWRSQDVVGKNPRFLKSGLTEPAMYEKLWETVRAGRDFHGALVNRRSDGESYVQDTLVSPVLGPTGEIAHFVSIGRDTSEAVRAEEKLRSQEALFAQIMTHAADVIFLFDPGARRFLYMSPAWERVAGRPPQPLLTDAGAFLESVHEDDRARVAHVLEDPMEACEGSLEFPVVRPDGRMRRLRLRLSPVPGAKCVGIAQDVTDLRQAEEALERSERLYRHSQKMEAVGRLAGGVAHDFNNLLTAILGYGEMLSETVGPGSDLQESVQEILKAGRRAAGLTRQLLAFSRRQVLQPVSMDLALAVSEMEKLIRRLIGEDLQFTSEAPVRGEQVLADPGQIEQVVMNLVVNARDAMPTGGRLTVSVASVPVDDARAAELGLASPGRCVRLAVSDTGSGISKEVRAHLFEPFFTTKEPGKGTGLGLATVLGIVQQSRGAVAVESEPGKGTTIEVFLPLAGPAPAAAAGEAAPLLEPAASGATETVLVAEDESAVRSFVSATLRRAGYRVLAASDGEEALGQASRHAGPIHLLVTDIVMPVLGGPDLARRLVLDRPGTPVLFMTGYTDTAVVQGILGEAGRAFLPKPFTPAALLQHVRAILSERANNRTREER